MDLVRHYEGVVSDHAHYHGHGRKIGNASGAALAGCAISISDRGDRADVLVDTSLAIALSDHEGHDSTMAAVPATRFLDERTAARLRRDLARLGIAGWAVYDALVAAAALQHDLRLLSRDRRALGVYEALGVDVALIT